MEAHNELKILRATLEATGRPKTWAAREMKVSYPHFHDVLNGRRNFSEEMRKRVKNLLCKMNNQVAV